MKTLDLQNKKVTSDTLSLITQFIYENRNELSFEVKTFYNDVRSFIYIQLRKPAKNRLSMNEILERMYNIEKYVMESGAAGFETNFIKG